MAPTAGPAHGTVSGASVVQQPPGHVPLLEALEEVVLLEVLEEVVLLEVLEEVVLLLLEVLEEVGGAAGGGGPAAARAPARSGAARRPAARARAGRGAGARPASRPGVRAGRARHTPVPAISSVPLGTQATASGTARARRLRRSRAGSFMIVSFSSGTWRWLAGKHQGRLGQSVTRPPRAPERRGRACAQLARHAEGASMIHKFWGWGEETGAGGQRWSESLARIARDRRCARASHRGRLAVAVW